VADFNGDGRLDLVTGNVYDNTVSVLLQAPVFSPSGTSLTFANQLMGTSSSAQAVTLSNTGSAAMKISSLGGSGDFAQTNNCGTTMASGGSCTISVTFTPTATGSRSGNLTITDDAVGSPHTVALSGQGTDFSLSSNLTSSTVTAGQSATFTLGVTPISGFNLSVALTCTKPESLSLSTCGILPSSVTPDGTNTALAIVTVTTTARSGAGPRAQFRPPPMGRHTGVPLQVWALLTLAMLTALRVARRRRVLLSLGACLLLVVLWAACGGSAGSAPTPSRPGTPSGTYTLTVTGTAAAGSGNSSHAITLTLKVN
jgi:hypothetical protein